MRIPRENLEIKSKCVVAACVEELLYEKMLPKLVVPQQIKDNLK